MASDASSDSYELVAALKQYKYIAPALSLCERLFVDAFWTRVVEYVPRWIAPNVLTLAGGACIAAALGLTLVHSPNFEGQAPPWVYCANAVLLLAYQTFDGIDGKQARRTGAGSPLGELMDHGVDAVVIGGVSGLIVDAFAFGLLSPWPWLIVAGAQASFHASNLTLLMGGQMLVNPLDACELQWTIFGALMLTAAGGSGLWGAALPFGLPLHDEAWRIDWRAGVPLRELLVVLSVAGMVRNLGQWFASLAATVRAAPAGKAQNRLARQLFRQVALLGGFGAVLAHCYLSVLAQPPTVPLAERRLALKLLLLCDTFCFGEAMARLLVERVATTEMPLAPPGLLCLLSFSAAASRGTAACAAVCALAAGLHLTYFVSTSRLIADALGIRVLRVGKKHVD